MGSVLNFRKAAHRRRIACLHSLLNQGLSRLWIVGLCGMHVLAISISFLENSGIVSVLFTMRCFWHWEQNSSQLALFNLHRGRSSSWGCKSPSRIKGVGSCCNMLLILLSFMASWGGIYIAQILIVLCKVSLTAIAWKWVLKWILLWGMSFLIRIETPPEALWPVLLMKL